MTPWVIYGIFFNNMPGRKIPLVTNQIYHVLNRGVASQPIFLSKKNYQRGVEAFCYYQNRALPLSYSHFLDLSQKRREKLLETLRKKRDFLVEIIAYCLIPNHFHFLLKQLQKDGISLFMSKFSNSYTRYFNTAYKRVGSLFQGKFKAVRIETDEQLIHVSRYIHLNPYSSYVVKTLKDLEKYPYSSLPEYLNLTKNEWCQKEAVLEHFKNPTDYKRFVFDRADYQRRLGQIKHLVLEKIGK